MGTPLYGNPDRPRLPEKVEQKFEKTDKLSAMAYTLLEHNTALMDALLFGGAVVADMEVTDSLIHDVQHVVQPGAKTADSEHNEGRATVEPPPEGGSGGR